MFRYIRDIIKNRELLGRLAKRAVENKHKGTFLGLSWYIGSPLVMLTIYTYVFTSIFKSRWPGSESTLQYALNIFAGLIVFNMFAECMSGSTTVITSNKNYVTKVIFPIEVLSTVIVGTALWQGAISAFILVAANMAMNGQIHLTSIYLPIIWMPAILVCMAIGWLGAAIGVYLKDIEQLINIMISILMFTSAVFFPISYIPSTIRVIVACNPIAWTIDQTRNIILEGKTPNTIGLLIWLLVGHLLCELTYKFFKLAKRGFADVL